MVKKLNNGFSLIEVVVAIVVFLFIGIAALSLLNARAVGVFDRAELQAAELSGEQALSALTSIAPDLEAGNSFQVLPDNEIKLEDCNDALCDLILLPEASDHLRTSPANGFPYSGTVPEGSQVFLVRRWRIEDVDGEYNLRKITVAVSKFVEGNQDNIVQPMILADSVVSTTR